MPFNLYIYRRVGDLETALRALPPAGERIFLVAGSDDRDLLGKMTAGLPLGVVRRWDELYRYFTERLNVENPRVQLDPPDHWLLLRELVRRYAENGGTLPPGAQRSGFLLLLGRQIRELISEEVGPDALDGLYDEESTVGTAFVALYRAYLDALDACRLSDSAGVTTQTRLLLDRPGAGDICRKLELVLVGFSSFTHSQLALTRALVRCGAHVRVYSPSAGMADAYGTAQQFGEDGTELSPRAPRRVISLESGDPRQEFETAARSLVLWEQGYGPFAALGPWPGWDSVAASVPRDRTAEAFEAFERYGVPYSPAYRVAVSETPLWRLSSACLDAASGDWQTEPVLRLFSSPWLGGENIDAAVLRAQHPRGDAWEKLLSGAAAETLEKCRAYAGAVANGGTPGELLNALRIFAAPCAATAAAQITAYPMLDGEIALFSRALKELDRKLLFIREVVRDLGEFGDQRLTGGDARAWLSAWADGTTVARPARGAGCMKIFRDTPPTLFRAPYCFIFGASAPAWPGGLKESPLLDETRRRLLHENARLGLDRTHLPLLSEQRKQREFLFRRLIACGDLCTFISHSATDRDDRPQEASPLIAAAESDGWCRTDAQVVRRLDSLLADPAEAAVCPVEARRPDLRREHGLPAERTCPGPLDIAADKNKVSLSSVDDYTHCPYFFAMRHLLKYPEPARPGEYDARLGGNAVHALWREVWTRYVEKLQKNEPVGLVALTEKVLDEIDAANKRGSSDQAIMKIIEEYPALWSPPLRRSLDELRWRIIETARLQQAIEERLCPLRAKTECEKVLPALRVGGVTFKGRCDRLETLNDRQGEKGEPFMLWDYKSGASNRYEKSIESLQLACYAYVILAERYGDDALAHSDECRGWGYICEKDARTVGVWSAGIAARLGFAVKNPDKEKERDQTIIGALENAKALLENIADSLKTRAFPPNFKAEKCPKCAFITLCRKGELTAGIGDDEEEDAE